jgi:hypothetical protein
MIIGRVDSVLLLTSLSRGKVYALVDNVWQFPI